MKIGFLTGGGDCAGENDTIRSAAMMAEKLGHDLYGIRDGWKGLIEFDEVRLDKKKVDNIGNESGTILRTTRKNPFKSNEYKADIVIENLKKNGYNALIVLGGEDTLSVAQSIHEMGFPLIGIPKTMDLDLQQYSVGFDTAASKAAKIISDMHTTARSHSRIVVLELFGRNAGHVALRSGIAGRADVILIPEIQYDMDEVCKSVKKAYDTRVKDGLDPCAIVVVSEGAKSIKSDFVTKNEKKDDFGHERLNERKIGESIADEIESRLGYETRCVQLTHIIRSGESGFYDSYMGEKLGAAALYLIEAKEFGKAVYDVNGNVIKTMLIKDLIKQKTVDVTEIPFYESMGINFGRPPQPYKPRIR